MTSGKGLGKGLSALIEVEEEPLVRGIRLRDIDPNPNQPASAHRTAQGSGEGDTWPGLKTCP